MSRSAKGVNCDFAEPEAIVAEAVVTEEATEGQAAPESLVKEEREAALEGARNSDRRSHRS